MAEFHVIASSTKKMPNYDKDRISVYLSILDAKTTQERERNPWTDELCQ